MRQIIIADNYELICEGIRRLLRNHPCVEVTAEARSDAGLISVLKNGNHKIDAILLDPNISDTGDVDLIRRIRAICPYVPILIFTAGEEDMNAVKLIRAGSQGFLSKKCSALQLTEAVTKITSGRLYVTELLAEFLALSVMSPGASEGHKSLSQREMEVFRLLVCGNTVTGIARALNLSAKTVSTHKTRIMHRMKFHSLSEMIQYAILNNLIEGPSGRAERASDVLMTKTRVCD